MRSNIIILAFFQNNQRITYQPFQIKLSLWANTEAKVNNMHLDHYASLPLSFFEVGSTERMMVKQTAAKGLCQLQLLFNNLIHRIKISPYHCDRLKNSSVKTDFPCPYLFHKYFKNCSTFIVFCTTAHQIPY